MLTPVLLKIPVSDLARSVSFYEQAFGLRAVFVAEQYGWGQMEGAGIGFALYVPGKGGGDRHPGGSVDFHLAHADLESLLVQVQGSAPDAAIMANDDGSRSLEVEDPDGNVLKIMAQPAG